MKKSNQYLVFFTSYPTDNPCWFRQCKYAIQLETSDYYYITYTTLAGEILGNKPISKTLENITYEKKYTANPNREHERNIIT